MDSMQTDVDRPPPFDFRDLHAFRAVCETGQMTRAAARLGITQSAASHAISRLERAFGVRLLDRHVRPMRPTTAGRRLLEYAISALDIAHRMPLLLSGQEAWRPHEIRLGCVDSLNTPFVPRLVQELKDVAGQLIIRSGLVVEHKAAFLEHDLDMLITTDPMEDVDGLERHRLLTEPYCVIVPTGAFAAGGLPDAATLAEVLPLIRSSARTLTGTQADIQLRRMRIEAPRRFEFDSFESVTSMVAAGMGWAIVSPLLLHKARAYLDGIDVYPFPGPRFSRTLTLVARFAELGDLPERVAAFARNILRQDYLPEFRAIGDWIEEAIAIG
jgi:DNA-binding transcriptional LysR family regulator